MRRAGAAAVFRRMRRK